MIKELIAHNISYIVAPYEADAELAYLSRMNLVDFVISDDSDLIAFGCPKILFKLNFNGVEFNAFIVRIVDAQNGIAVFPNGFERKITHLRIGVRTQKARCEKNVMPEVKCGVEYALRALESAKRQQKRSE